MSRYYGRDGAPIDRDVWSERFSDPKYQAVSLTQLPEVAVSTVWLGLDHRWGSGPPLIFETMVFGGALDGEQVRYSTEAQAVAGHAAMIERVKVAEVEAAARARLVEAAPDLLTVLDEILDYRGGADNALQDEYIVARAVAARAKARGDS